MSIQTTLHQDAPAAVVEGVSPLLLDACPRFSGVALEDLSRLASASECQLARAGDVLYRQGEASDGVYLILDGDIRLERSVPESTLVDRSCAVTHATFGDRALLGEARRHHTATAAAPSVVVKMPLDAVQELIHSYPQLAGDWTYEILTRRARRAFSRGQTDLVDRVLDLFSAA